MNVLALIKRNKSFIGLIILCMVISIFSAEFRTSDNMMIVLRQSTANAIIAIGMTFVILTGGIDLSVGSILAFSSAVCAYLLSIGTNSVVACCAALIIGAGCGLLNGFFVSYVRLQPFITTLVSMTVFRGLTMSFSGGKPIGTGESAFFDFLGNGYIFSVPFPVVMLLILFVIAYYTLNNTRFGRYVYAIGGNEDASKLAGINVAKNKMMVYMLSGMMAALAGLIITSRLSSAQPTAGGGYELDAIAAVVVGGTSLSGGIGFVQGTIAGALIIGVIANALNILGVQSYSQMVVKGFVILMAVMIDQPTVKGFFGKFFSRRNKL